ncbi:LysR substrate-binding domain-containing protein [Caballeronia sp. LZ043]|uniref:LysR substrate-binding domain-containing protein n=1 Tax=Caballeronia sp. LZ043 TaxID=3038569 RepID=UPI00286130D2|nr:LysR substrate-binding domain-containing protein [Caballeronia sp. LZ043]MDR5822125.1 LysR substrate-binding domain-containing protein [Caballeronia sp. LZ043]
MTAESRKKNGEPADTAADARRVRFPPLKSLIAFEAAARHGSFTQGADEIGITTSAVSHHIQQLEDFLGVPLFQRHAGRAVLTVAGRSYARELEKAFGLIANATNALAPQSCGGYLAIAVPNSFSVKWLQPRLQTFLKANPLFRVRLATLHTHELDSNRYDIAIAHGPQTPGLKLAEPLLVERLRPLCSPQLARELALESPRDLARATLIHSNNPLNWVDYFRRVGNLVVKPAHDLWLDRSAMAIEAAVEGLGVVLESEILAEEELRDGRLIEPFPDPKYHVDNISYYLLRSSSLRNSAEAAVFEKWLRAALETAHLRTMF